ncbi:LOW QUALITY PROTEIN: hypothetical protein QYF61_020070 [Mycteria americana]|uniref:Uncharacterized protein n=1 Tax=Mycteria americana TaxID=33587 RepID=A0AAN7S436_MYCAM|nr:LOW QUALITY PROTEIN: hypothetical protein QYF61_020070 [Mycteria americana]
MAVRAKQPQLSQPVLVGEALQPSDHFCGPPLDPLQQLHVLLVLRAPELDAVLQVRSHQSRVEGQNHLPRPAGHASFDAAQDTVGLLGCERTLLAHVQLFVHQYPQVLFRRAALAHIIPQPVLKLRIAPTQDPALGLIEVHKVHTGPLLQLVQVPLDDISSFWSVNCTTQLGVICKLAEGALDLTVNVIDENTEQHWSQYGPLRDTTPIDRYPLDVTIQPIPYPLNSPPIKSVSLQFREKDVVGDCVKGFTEVQIDDTHRFTELRFGLSLPTQKSHVVGRVMTMTQRNSLASNFINWRIPQTDKLNDLMSLTNEQRRFGNGAIFRATQSQTCIYILEKQRKREARKGKEKRGGKRKKKYHHPWILR